jgi:hypothetical protein
MLFACQLMPVIVVFDKLSVIHPPPDKTQLNNQSAQLNGAEVPLRPGKICGRYGFAFRCYKQTVN